ncbi:MAG: DUF2225 domain-containing protein [Defluviitaleaceae bacterium]|nr:DUF2225 domain-containing protein [Defluviitaleaceae bacterium]MCL2836892.1 DUF2225 domain-containing protein [Defluviitaleaceae bacterium]
MPQNEAPIDPKDYIYEKKYTCPCCEEEFLNYTVRASRVRFRSADTDLRSHFTPFDPLYYDALICPFCGHAAMSAFMGHVTDAQAQRVKAEITSRFIARDYPIVYTPQDAIERMKYALLTAVVKNVKASQQANICLKLSWVYRDAGDPGQEMIFAKRALEGFVKAVEKEVPPISGMDSDLVTYLIGDLYRRTGSNSEALKWLGRVLVDKGVKRSIKDKALIVKEIIDGHG